jgi:protein-tyrosine phosphatase
VVNLIDIHSHILSGVDDGAAKLEESLALARIYVESGYRRVVATPHAAVDSLPSENYARTVQELVKSLNHALLEQRIELVVMPGMEVGLDPLLPEMVAQGKILTLAGTRYLLVETSFKQLPLNWWEVVFKLAAKGILVIFAHPERCAQVADEPEILDRMAQAGAKFQVDWDSFSGANGRRVAKVVRSMARKGFIHCLATDSHDPKVRNARNVREIGRRIKDLIGDENLRRIAEENPARVIQGKPLLEMEHGGMPKLGAEKKVFRKFWFWPLFRMMGKR